MMVAKAARSLATSASPDHCVGPGVGEAKVPGASVVDDCDVPGIDKVVPGTDKVLPSHGQPAEGVRTVAGAAIAVPGEQASIGSQMGAATVAGMATAWLYAVGE
jgi:hypothetical protein